MPFFFLKWIFIKLHKLNIFAYLESIEDDALIVASNTENDDEHDLGLIAGHAYAIDDFEGSIHFDVFFSDLI